MVEKSQHTRQKNSLSASAIHEYQRIARDLGYSASVREALGKATSQIQCEQILKSARDGKM